MRKTFVFALFVSVLMPCAAASAATLRTKATAGEGLEGNAGSVANVPITFFVSDPAHPTITGDWQTVDGTATAADGDYKKDSGTFTIQQGETSTTFQVQVFGDNKVENNETFTIETSNVKNSPPFPTLTVTILNDDVPVVSVSSPKVAEGNAGTQTMPFTITLTPPAAVPVNVAYQTVDGTATAGQDYQAASGPLTLAPGQATTILLIPINGDVAFEPDETFSLIVTPTAALSSGPLPGPVATGTGTITNDDSPPPARLSIVSGNGQQGRLGQPLPQPLVVEVVNAQGAPVAGVVVQWTTKGGAQLNPATSTTNTQGRASTIATLTSVGAVEVQATVAQLAPVTFTFASETSLEQRATGPVAVPIAKVLDQICARNETTFNDVCRALSALPDAQLTPTLEHAAPQQSGAQSKVASEVVSAVASGIGSRLAALRSGAERFSVQRLSLNYNGRPIPVGALAKALFPAALGGGAGDDNSDYNGWSAFLSGNLGSGERIGRDGQLGFDLRSRGLMLGVDRQFGNNVFGLSVNAMKLDSTLNDSVGSLDTNGYALSIYGSRSGLFAGNAPPAAGTGTHYDGVHLDGSFTVGRNRYDAEHVVPELNSSAHSNNHANVFALSGVTGVNAHRGRTDYDVSLSGTWSRARIDDLTEDGSGPLILFVQGHEIESVVGNASLNVRTAVPVPFGTLLPTFRAEMVHEFTSGARLVTARFLRDHLDTAFTIPIDRPDANYGRLGAGLEAVFAKGYSALIEVTQDVLRSDLHFRTLQFNLHKAF